MWKTSKQVETPNIEDDIRRLLSGDVLKVYQQADENVKKRITRITELLDLVDHLDNFKNYLCKIDKPEHLKKENVIYKISHIEFDGHNYSGCQYDIEALIYYLYVSIIDTCMGPNTYKSVHDFMDEKTKNTDDYGCKDILTWCHEYQETYGLSKNFKKVFLKQISDGLKQKFADGILILGSKPKRYKESEIENKWDAWHEKDIDEKMKKISEFLYSMRSKYTHSGIREFIPSSDWDEEKEVSYVVKENADILCLLRNVILELCEKF